MLGEIWQTYLETERHPFPFLLAHSSRDYRFSATTNVQKNMLAKRNLAKEYFEKTTVRSE
jgi:hypothetical protein